MKEIIQDRIIGSFMGLAVGDALGAPVEGTKPIKIAQRFGVLRDYAVHEDAFKKAKMMGYVTPGLYTDDTQQALVYLFIILSSGKIDPEKTARWFAKMGEGGKKRYGVFRGSGLNFRKSVNSFRDGVPWYECGTNTAGNGAAMRIAPVALFYYRNLYNMADKVIDTSLFTHRNPLGLSSAVGVAYLIATLLTSDPAESVDTVSLLKDTARFCKEIETEMEENISEHFFPGYEKILHSFSETLEALSGMMDASHDDIWKWIPDNATTYTHKRLNRPTLGFALASVIYSIYLAMKHIDSFEEAVVAAINAGGDTDTNAAITGSISGARHGLKGIPARWLDGLVNGDIIEQRVRKFASGRREKYKVQDLLNMEKGLTQQFDYDNFNI